MAKTALIRHVCNNEDCGGEFTFSNKRKKCPNCGTMKLVAEAPAKKSSAKSNTAPKKTAYGNVLQFVDLAGEFKEDSKVMKKIKYTRTPRRDPVQIDKRSCVRCGKQFQPTTEFEEVCQRCIMSRVS